ncbi:sodium:proton antiporter [Thermus thermophilus]|uniref:cation:proton antiporter domain-containing protein n=1 Tax=Thermus thermophilus TaxID=274 RepID=UPI001FCA9DA5|nr:cation:proton antiporter [Thermus thermophilus]BDG18166.1 sodium:proton antiporter [Thermus thermophilus]
MSGSLLLLFVFLAAFLAPPLSRLLRMPVPVGELVIGLLLGHFLAQGVALPEILGFLADFGFLLLMFLAGLEVDFNLLRQLERRHFVFYTLYVVGMFLGAGLLAGLLGVGLAQALILALVSIGLMVATLRDMGILGRAFAKRVLILGVLGEVASLFGLTAMEKAAHYQGLLSLLREVGIIALFFLLLFFLLLFLAFRLAGLFLWWYPEVGRRLVYEEDPSAMGIRLSLALMFAAAVMSGLVGLESVLGAFLAGMILSYFLQKKHDLEAKLSAMGYGFLIPIFFIRTGMGIDLSGLDGRLLLEVGQALLLMLLIRLLPAPFLLLGGFRLREAFLAALLLAYPFTLMIAGTEIARSAHLLDERAALVLLLAAALSSLLFPWAAKMLLRFLR